MTQNEQEITTLFNTMAKGNALTPKEQEVKAFFDNMAKAYRESWDFESQSLHVGVFNAATDTLEDAYRNATNQLITNLNTRPLSSTANVLDICCGTGATLETIAKRFGCTGTGVDLSDEQIAYAIARVVSSMTFKQGSAAALETLTEAGVYTHAVSQDGIFLVPDKEKCFAGISRALMPGGILAITDFIKAADFGNKLVSDAVRWQRGNNIPEYIAILENAGLHVISAEDRTADMRRTYELLIPRAQAFAEKQGAPFDMLVQRYEAIVKSIDAKELQWGLFVAEKVKS